MLYSDHGSDVTSRHLEQVRLELRIELVHSTAGVPQRRGKIERFFGTITTELLPALPGHLTPGSGTRVSPLRLSLAELDEAIGRARRAAVPLTARRSAATDTHQPRPPDRPSAD